MLPQLTAVDVLVGVLAVGFLAALFGWVGGAGALRSCRARLSAFEDTLEIFDGRIKRREGAAGQVATQRRKSALQERDDEADKLAQALSRRHPNLGVRVLTEQDAEEAQLLELEREARAKGLMGKGKAS